MATTAEILTELRKDAGLTQQKMAKILHISASSISAYEIGVRMPTVEVLLSYAEYFDVSADYILGLVQHSDSLSTIKEEFALGKSNGDVLEQMTHLLPEQKQALLIILKSMRLYADIAEKTNIQKIRNAL